MSYNLPHFCESYYLFDIYSICDIITNLKVGLGGEFIQCQR